MEWSDEELSDVISRGSSAAPIGIRVPALPASTLKAMMTRAVKLAAERGGTMTAEALAGIRASMTGHDHMGRAMQAKLLFEHISTLGARNAVLEQALGQAREARTEITTALVAIRRRSLEAANLERLIAEHGLPAAMRWVVDGEEPAQSLVKTVTVSAGMAGGPLKVLFRTTTYPCSSTCTHDDAATPGHPERVKERSEAFNDLAASVKARNGMSTDEARAFDAGVDSGAEAMRAACLKDVREALANVGAWDRETERIVAAAIEGATP